MSNRNYDVTSLGELLIDFTENGTSAQGNPIMEANPGGEIGRASCRERVCQQV